MRELAVKAADEGDVKERLAVEAFLGAISWHFTRKIRVKQIESLKEALEEAKLTLPLRYRFVADSRKMYNLLTLMDRLHFICKERGSRSQLRKIKKKI